MRLILLSAALLAAGACGGGSDAEFATVRYADASGDFSAEVPKAWKPSDGPDLMLRPVARVTFGDPVSGAAVRVTRVTRLIPEMPREDLKKRGFISFWLAPSDVLFGMHPKVLDPMTRSSLPDMREETVNGRKARAYERDYEDVGPGGGKIAMRLTDTVVQTNSAYYVIEYSAPRDVFEAHKPKYEKFLSTFLFGPGA